MRTSIIRRWLDAVRLELREYRLALGWLFLNGPPPSPPPPRTRDRRAQP